MKRERTVCEGRVGEGVMQQERLSDGRLRDIRHMYLSDTEDTMLDIGKALEELVELRAAAGKAQKPKAVYASGEEPMVGDVVRRQDKGRFGEKFIMEHWDVETNDVVKAHVLIQRGPTQAKERVISRAELATLVIKYECDLRGLRDLKPNELALASMSAALKSIGLQVEQSGGAK